MLFNTKVLRRLMKNAYNRKGLTVGIEKMQICPGNPEEKTAYVLNGGNWTVNILADFMPKEIKAMIMECAGELPGTADFLGPGDFFTCYKKEPTNYAFNEIYVPPIAENMRNAVPDPVDISSMSIWDRRIIQVSGRKVLLNNVFLDLLNGTIDYENGETDLLGKLYSDGAFYFWNNTCLFMALEAGKTDTEKTILNNLMMVDIFGKHIQEEENGRKGTEDRDG